MNKIWMKDGKFVDITDEQKNALTVEELSAYTTDKSNAFVNNAIAKVNADIDAKMKSTLTKAELETVKSDFNEALKALPTEALAKYVETIEALKSETKSVSDLAKEIQAIVKEQGVEIKAKAENTIPEVRRKASRLDQMKTLIQNSFASKEFEAFEGNGFKGYSEKMFLDQNDGKIELKSVTSKATIDTSSHTGTVLISETSDIVRDDAPTRMNHVRDLINVSMTDQAQVVAGQVYDFTDALTLGAIMLAENGEAPESVFKSKENTWGLKRIANSMRLSKREIKVNGLQWVIDKVMAKLPDATLFVEDVQLLFGDGAGENVKGLAVDAQDFNLVPNTYIAGAVASVATYNSGTQSLVTFAAAHGIKNGDNVTFANATEASYNATHYSVEVINSKQIVIDLTYVAEADTSAWTGTDASPFYHAIDSAQEYDVLAVSDANLEAGEFNCTAHIVHPSQATQIGLLKATDGNYLNITKDSNNKVMGVNGKPLVTTTAVPMGKFFSGDFSRNGLELREFTPLNIQFVEDVDSVKKNEIVVVIEEEIIFPIYNPYWFTYGKFSTAKTQLETP